MFDWNDLRHLLAVSHYGSTTAAAVALGVNQSTVQRRLAQLERSLGRALVRREPTGYVLTPLGQALLPLTEQVAEAVAAVEREVRATDQSGRAIIRLTCPEPVIGRLQPFIDRFHAKYPGFKVEFVTSDHYLDLLKGEADVAFRSGDTDNALVGRKVADSIWGLYASAAYVDRNGRLSDVSELNSHKVVSLDETMERHRLVLWLDTVAPRAEVVSRSNSILGLVQAAKSGIGIAALPMAIAKEAGLVKLLGPIDELARAWKLLTHPALRGTPRVSAFFDFVAQEREALKTIFS
jgi:DNA-binding transcriptional LysR family regulator